MRDAVGHLDRTKLHISLQPPTRAAVLRGLGTFAGLLVLSVIATWPLALHMDEFLFVTDPMGYAWDFWWVKESLLHLQNPWFTRMLLAPDGSYLAFHSLVPLVGLVSAPFTALLGPGLVYNVLKLLLPMLAAFTAQRLAKQLGLQTWSSWLSGCLYGFSTIVVWRTTFHMNLGSGLALMPLPVLFCARFDAERRSRDAVLAGVSVGALVLCDPTMAFFAVLVALPYVVIAAIADRGWRPWAKLTGLAGAATVVVSFPQLAMMVRAAGQGGYEPNLEALAANWVTANVSLRTMLSPGAVREFVPGRLEAIPFQIPSGEATPVFGWAALALALAAVLVLIVRRGRDRPVSTRVLVWCGVLFVSAIVLAMGPEVRLGAGVHVPFPIQRHGQTLSGLMPYTWLTSLPLFADVRVPARFVMLGILPLAVLAGVGAQLLVKHLRALGVVLVVIGATFGVLESGEPDGGAGGRWVPMHRDRLYAPIKADKSASIVVDVPLGFLGATAGVGHAREQEGMLRAAEHGHPIAGAYLSRLTQDQVNHLAARPFYGQILTFQDPPGPNRAPPDVALGRADAEQMNVGWVVVWPEADRGIIPVLQQEGFRQVLEDDGVVLLRR